MRTRSGREYEFKMKTAKTRRSTTARAIRKRSKKSRGKFEQKVKRIIQKQHPVKVTPNTVSLLADPSFGGVDFGANNNPQRGTGPGDREGHTVMLKGVRLEYNYSHGTPAGQRGEDITVKIYVVSTTENDGFGNIWFRNNEGNSRVAWTTAFADPGIGRMGILTQPLNTDEYKVHFSKTIKLRCRYIMNGNSTFDYVGKSYVKLNKKIEFLQDNDVGGNVPGLAGLKPRVAVMIYYTHGHALPPTDPPNLAQQFPPLLGNTAVKWYWTEL